MRPVVINTKMFKKIFLLVSLFFFTFYCGKSQTKRALIIAIGNYPSSGGWDNLNSLNDVPLIQEVLLMQNFLPANITVLTDNKATKKGIIDALDHLIATSQKGDIAVIHASAHGEQIEDDNGDEADGLDESIVPFDAVYSDNKADFNKVSAEYLRDDLFGEKITLLRNKLGRNGDVLVTIDACHSGSGTRGAKTKVRGGKPPMVSNSFDERKLGIKDTAGVFSDKIKAKLSSDAASFVLISAALAQELNCECFDDQRKAVGSLSYAFGKILGSLKGAVTYRTLFSRMDDLLQQKVSEKPMPNCKQNPVLEGDGIDRELFGGQYQQQEPFFTINKAKSNSAVIEINGGTVAGITIGSFISFYPDNVLDPTGKIALQKGKVIAVQNFTSTVKLDKPNPTLLKNIVKAFVLQVSYGTGKIKLSLDSLDKVTRQKMLEILKGFPLTELNSDCEVYFAKSISGEKLALYFPVSGDLFTDTLDINNTSVIKDVLKRYDRFRYLKGLRTDEQGLSANVDLLFLDQSGTIDSNMMREKTKLGQFVLKEGDIVNLKIKNTGSKAFYINIVDLQPDGIINPIIPNKNLGIRADDCKVDINDSLLFRENGITIYPPYGKETFKVFLSPERIDLEEILTGKNVAGTRGVFTDLEKVFKESEVNERGIRGNSGKVSTQSGTIFNINFIIVPK
ncbi:MAG TPA: caspase family protein [Chitinophagaceae bacterium]|nr:caspase family protein [Chitinophagaceae bacterium]